MSDRKKLTVIPFGPQHPVLPEPIQLQFYVDEERIVDVLPNIGYVHRGIEAQHLSLRAHLRHLQRHPRPDLRWHNREADRNGSAS